MDYDFAIIYFGLTRSVIKTHESHKKYIFDVLHSHNLKYKTFMHTWKTNDDTQYVWEKIIPQKINYEEYKLLHPDVYRLDNQTDFLATVNMDNYFYKDVWDSKGHSKHGEWLPQLIKNHICALESQKRCFGMVKDCVLKGDTFKFVMFIRPDITIHNELPITDIIPNHDKISIPNHRHHEGLNDQFAITNYENGNIYSNRISELAEFRKNNSRIVSEKYLKFIILKYGMKINELDFKYDVTRPC
jgi:hypothetical protein